MIFYKRLPVPYVTIWTKEHERASARFCRFAGAKARWNPHAPGAGKPLWKETHPVRVRRAIKFGLCSVCGEKLQADDRFISRENIKLGTILGSTNPDLAFVEEPPLCAGCVSITTQSCPHHLGTPRNFVALPTGLITAPIHCSQKLPQGSVVIATYTAFSIATFNALGSGLPIIGEYAA